MAGSSGDVAVLSGLPVGTAFSHWPRWEKIAGGRWVYDVTYHPDAGPGQALVASDHPMTATLQDFGMVDER